MYTYFDYFYAILYVILLVFSYSYYKSNDKRIAWAAIVITFIFIGFRAPVVGADTWNYVRYLTGERYFYNYDPRPLEPLFIYYREIINSLTDSRFFVMLVNTIVTITPVLYMIRKYSLNVPLSLLLFFYFGSYSVYFIGLRQVIGISFIILALLYIFNNRERKLVDKITHLKEIVLLFVSIIIAYYFHTSNIIFGGLVIVSYLIQIKERIIGYILICGSAVFGLILEMFDVSDFFNSLYMLDIGATERLSNYIENYDRNEFYELYYMIRISIIGLIIVYFVPSQKVNHIIIKLFILGIVLFNLFYSVPMIYRFVPVFYLFGCISFTWIMESKSKLKYKPSHTSIIVTILVVLFYTRSTFITLSNWDPRDEGRLHPYYFYFQDYSDHPSIKYFGK